MADFPIILVDDFQGATDSLKIQAAINFAEKNNQKVVVSGNRTYSLNAPIVIKKGVEVQASRATHYTVQGNFRVFELQQDASLVGGFITINSSSYNSDVIYLDGKYQYEKTCVKDLYLTNWSGKNGGTAIKLYAGANGSKIQYINFENISISRFSKGIFLQAVKPASGEAWVNANRFDKITLDGCTDMIVLDSSKQPPNECSGNVFTNLQIQPSSDTNKLVTITGTENQFDGMSWDLHFIKHTNPVVEFKTASSGNQFRILLPYNRIVNNGDLSNSKGRDIIPLTTSDPTTPTIGQIWLRVDL
ncbi:hypothetical protein [Paenisporosarcina sp. NPDC076898]|uniref:hypothetical protein n=1 Tax=unclassified Paenisporosarcina TaxID=2642018 RepID=UPI003CFFB96D